MPRNSINLATSKLQDSLVSSDGTTYKINPDFRIVLACLERLADPDKKDIEKVLFLAHHFFLKETPPDMAELFSDFITGGETADDREEALLDFAQDSGVIYASFRQQYGINLLTERLHWAEFQQLLAGLNQNTAFGRRIQLRTLDINTLPEKERAKWRRLKDEVAVKQPISKAEHALQEELDRRLAAGEDPTTIINQLKGAE